MKSTGFLSVCFSHSDLTSCNHAYSGSNMAAQIFKKIIPKGEISVLRLWGRCELVLLDQKGESVPDGRTFQSLIIFLFPKLLASEGGGGGEEVKKISRHFSLFTFEIIYRNL